MALHGSRAIVISGVIYKAAIRTGGARRPERATTRAQTAANEPAAAYRQPVIAAMVSAS